MKCRFKPELVKKVEEVGRKAGGTDFRQTVVNALAVYDFLVNDFMKDGRIAVVDPETERLISVVLHDDDDQS